MRSLVFTTDSYKVGHYLQQPKGTKGSYYYIEAEWAIDDYTLNIPTGGYLYILMSKIPLNVIKDFNDGK
jgi:hypothetical protein